MPYASVTAVKSYLGIASTADDALLTTLLTAAQAAIDAYTHRTFEAPVDTVRRFDAELDTSEAHTLLDWTPYGLDLAQITSIVNGDGVTIPVDAYVLEPRHYPPYYGIKLKVSSGLYFEDDANGDHENAIAVTGRWAYSVTAPADVAHACVRWATYLYRQKDSGVYETTIIPGAGVMEVPMGIPRDVQMLLGRHPGDKYVRGTR